MNTLPLLPIFSHFSSAHNIYIHIPFYTGPTGANVFVRHLPKDFTDEDLATLFTPFGNIVSATVFVDMETSNSRGFGQNYDLYMIYLYDAIYMLCLRTYM